MYIYVYVNRMRNACRNFANLNEMPTRRVNDRGEHGFRGQRRAEYFANILHPPYLRGKTRYLTEYRILLQYYERVARYIGRKIYVSKL